MGTTLMTGATRGLGRYAAEHLLRSSEHLVVFARGEVPLAGPNLTVIPCDLTSFADIRRACEEFSDLDLPPLTRFVGNAGVQHTSTSDRTVDGFERTFAVNVLAYHLMLRLLMDRFGAGSRVLVVGSDVHFGTWQHGFGAIPPPRWDDVRKLAAPRPGGAREGRRAYATSKLGVIYLVHALQRRLPEGVDAYTYNPGFVPGTGLVRDAHPVGRAVVASIGQVLRLTPKAMGQERAGRVLAETVVGARLSEGGAYIDRGRVVPSSAESYDVEREEELWRVADELCGVAGYRADHG
ncbi:protochlorophyllide reductase [Saccharothrix mutabilis subsp. mutabilis]|uniref:Protochlorophyllide reductase n=1 Tax=Saccharothrix mutabilis subsp. mutabilis TaxID=66855 RepID=A0ABP3CMX2_9PSEU